MANYMDKFSYIESKEILQSLELEEQFLNYVLSKLSSKRYTYSLVSEAMLSLLREVDEISTEIDRHNSMADNDNVGESTRIEILMNRDRLYNIRSFYTYGITHILKQALFQCFYAQCNRVRYLLRMEAEVSDIDKMLLTCSDANSFVGDPDLNKLLHCKATVKGFVAELKKYAKNAQKERLASYAEYR